MWDLCKTEYTYISPLLDLDLGDMLDGHLEPVPVPHTRVHDPESSLAKHRANLGRRRRSRRRSRRRRRRRRRKRRRRRRRARDDEGSKGVGGSATL
jgi:hypothetical protein